MLTVEDITQKLTPVFEQNGVTKAILFGSYAKGTADENSDVDIVVETEPKNIGSDFYLLLEDIMATLEKKVELVSGLSLSYNRTLGLHVERTGKVIYER
jgi:predicted nucleotidyltransferase